MGGSLRVHFSARQGLGLRGCQGVAPRAALLKLCLRDVGSDRYPLHPANYAFPDRNDRTHVSIDLRDWSIWMELLSAGTTPLEATRLIVSGGEANPRGMVIDMSRRIVSSTDDAG